MKILQQALQLAQRGKFDGVLESVSSAEDVLSLDHEKLTILHKIILSPHVYLVFSALQRSGFLYPLLPELKEVVEFRAEKQFKEIWPHTLQVMSQAPQSLAVRWAALFHDMGKAKAFSIKDGKVTFHQHEHISARIFKEFSLRTKLFSPGLYKRIQFLVYNLGYIEGYEPSWTDSAVRRFAKEMGEYLDDILLLSAADITTKHLSKKNAILARIENLRNRIKTIAEEDEKSKSKLPKGFGHDIMEQLGVSDGREIGKMKEFLEQMIESGDIEANNEDRNYYLNYLKEKYMSRDGNIVA
jgi:poly(A) polymerase